MAIAANSTQSYQGPVRVGDFNVSNEDASILLKSVNPHLKPTSDVLRPTLNGTDITKRPREQWVIDFFKEPEEIACFYERPFAIVEKVVRPLREKSKRDGRKTRWWQHGETGDAMRRELSEKVRFLCMAQTAKRILFRWYDSMTYPEPTVIVIARSEDIFFGILHSHIHQVWALAQGTQLREKESGFRYTPTTCFVTFPFPMGVIEAAVPLPATHAAIAAAAKELNELRENWLNPPEWTREEIMEFPGTVGGPWDRFIDPATVTDRAAFKVGTVRYPRLVARDAASAARLKERTLTKLYNVRPAWLAACHAKLDAAVAAAYGWPADLTEEAILERLLALNQAATL